MNISHISFPSRRPSLPAWRLLLATGAAVLALVTAAQAATYYVSSTATPGSGTGTSASPWTLGEANAAVGPGDTVRLKTGTYTGQQIKPTSPGGTSTLPITYIKDTTTVTLSGSPAGQPQVDFTSKSWIVVDGITLTDSTAQAVKAVSSTHCTVQNCTIAHANNYAGVDIGAWPPATPTTYLTIRNCTFPDSNYNGTTGGPGGDLIYHRYSDHTLIDNCTFGNTPHTSINLQRGSSYVIVQNCTVRNTWHHNMSCYTNDAENGGPTEEITHIVYQDNRSYDASIERYNNPTTDTAGTNGLEVEASDCIFRRNIIHRSDPFGTNSSWPSDALGMSCWIKGNPTGQSSISNRTYNNVFAGWTRGLIMGGSPPEVLQDNVWKNNIFFMNTQRDVETLDIGGTYLTAIQSLFAFNNFYGSPNNSRYKNFSGSILAIQGQFPSEWNNNTWVPPQFTNVTFGSSPARDFTLSTGSPMIDAGDFLTTTNGSGTNSRTVVVADAKYFCDGFGIIPGDMVVVGSNPARLVTAVNYSTNTLTLDPAAPAITWTSGVGVSLPYNGAKPDMGAFESTAPSIPTAPTGLTATAASSSQINLTWNPVTPAPLGYKVYRGTTAGSHPTNVSGNISTTSYNDTNGLSPDTTYYYDARAYNAVGDSNPSTEASARTDPAGTGAFQMSGNQVVMEAEHATSRTAGTPTVRNWTDITESGASGGASNNAVQALPNSGGSVTPGPGPAACRADYEINVPAGSAANFYVHLRGRAAGSTDDSVYVSIDGSTATFLTIFPPVATTLGTWVSAGTLAIPSGTHTVTLWMREDGAIIDKIVVKDNATLPTGTGPAESPQGGSNSVPVITTTTLPGTIAGESYSQTLAATGGDGTLVWSVSSGALPAGLSLSSGGVISGSATTAGTANFTVKVADSDGVTGAGDEDTQALSIVVTANSVPVITTTTLPGTITGESYSQTLAATGGNGSLVWSLASGALPAGLSLSSGGVISGSATTAGTANFTVKVADSDGVTGAGDEDTQALSIVVTANSVPVITTTTLPGTIAGESYSQTLAATGGNGTLVWSLASGTLPAGLSLSSGGVISGSATTAGTANFTVKVADSDGVTGAGDEDTQALSIVVTANSVPSITTTTLPAGTSGVSYSQTLAATGGNGSLVWSLASGALPAGLSLSSGGVISGTPAASGTANFTVKVADSDGVTGAGDEDTQALSLVINPGAFQMSGNQVVMEAEHATSRTAGTPTVRNWTDITESGASGGASNNAVQALPNSGGSVTPGPGTAACRADYQINVPTGSAASFYVHLRGRAAGGTDDSVYVSIDGGTATFLTIFPPVATTLGSWVSAGTLSIPSGTHTVTLWMREDGAIIDKIVVKDNATLPTGTGPAESPR